MRQADDKTGNEADGAERNRFLEAQLLHGENEIRVHTLQTSLQGILADAEEVLFSLRRGDPDAVENAKQDTIDLVSKIKILALQTRTIRSNLPEFKLVVTNMHEVTDSAVQMMKGLARSKQVELKFASDRMGLASRAHTSKPHIEHAIQAILHNAVKYSFSATGRAEQRFVIVTLSSSQSTWLLEVENYGVRIDPDELPHVFRAGVRGRHAKLEDRSGSGQGLFHASQICDEHSGTISITCKSAGAGAGVVKVRMEIPLEPPIRG
ncbi:MAG: HAMP domain-containing sensor histidine kinase [Gemmatimonadales bacterium]